MNPASADADANDMARLAEGHDAALNQLMERHAPKLFQYLLRSLQNEEDAADLAQETFVRVYQHRGEFDSRRKFSTWLYAIAANLARDRFRWRSRHPTVSLEEQTSPPEVRPGDGGAGLSASPDQKLQAEERVEAVRQAIAALPEELKQPLILAIYEELPQAEIAGVLRCSVKAVETRLYRARQQLRARLSGWV